MDNGVSSRTAVRDRLVLGGAAFGLLGVALGAFGAHALSDFLGPESMEIFETAVRYQLVHAVALLALAGLVDWNPVHVRRAGALFALGIAIFSGSLFALVFSGVGWFGAVTPIGGLCFLCGWGLLAWGALGGRDGGPSS